MRPGHYFGDVQVSTLRKSRHFMEANFRNKIALLVLFLCENLLRIKDTNSDPLFFFHPLLLQVLLLQAQQWIR